MLGGSAFFRSGRWRSETVRGRVAAVAGAVLLSLVAILFARLADLAQQLFVTGWRAQPLLMPLLTPMMFVAVVHVTRRWFPAARGSGIPQVMAAADQPALAASGPLVSLRTAAAKLAGTLAMLLAGGSVGREGPTVQVSAAVLAAMHRWLRVPISRGVLIAGGAAGVAAAFNTPLAGVAFAIEELATAFEQRVAVYVMAVVMIAGLVSLGLTGDYVYFGLVAQSIDVPTMLLVAPLAGVAGGAAGGLFARVLVTMVWSRQPWVAAVRAHPLRLALGGGVVVALCGVLSDGQSWGTGYDTTRALLSGQNADLLFGPAKFLATLATALSGAPGGIFAPSLSVGAGLGQVLAQLFPGSSSGAIVLLGMAGYFTAVVRAPLTSVIIMMEMTADRSMILPLFATAIIADWVGARVCRPKLYKTLSRQFR
ncbi:chloride channel protein [Sandarakinorhabdus oryzae]|uniref:chloride channel protein n=1 Tax=Sandarakinorhabdus oryzae TaxID=2675220 RepID=UPI0012E1844B|nr:chloride channel protein [Sandarakinorhabdus oryzae]